MADVVDVANAYIDNAIERELHKRQQNTRNVKGAKFCKNCSDLIPIARQQLGFQFCIECAEETERRKALFANS